MRTEPVNAAGRAAWHAVRGPSRGPGSWVAVLAAVAVTALGQIRPAPLAAQAVAQGNAQGVEPSVRTLLTGYGAVGYTSALEGDPRRNDFTGFLSLVPLARLHEDVLVEGEVEIALHGAETLLVLEHVEVHYQGFENLQLRAGKFHLPVGVWMHTNWTNKMPTPPLLYEDTHGEAATSALMPIPFDVGAMANYTIPGIEGWRTSASFWVSQGPVDAVGGGHAHEGEHAHEGAGGDADAPLLAYGSNYEDNNEDKMLGLAFRAVSAGGLTLHAAGYRAAYDETGERDVSAANLGVVWSPGEGGEPLFELKGEGTLLRQEYLLDGVEETVDMEGYYLQLSKRLGALEPVARWSHLPRTVAGSGVLVPRRRQLALGVNYWITPSVPVKAAYHYEADRDDRLYLEWAVGF